MVARSISRPVPHLAAFAIITLSVFGSPTRGSELSAENNAVPAANLNQQFVFALLGPISGLVESPYSDPASVANPLKMPERLPFALVDVHTEQSTQKRLEMLNADAERPVRHFEITSSAVPEDALPKVDAIPWADSSSQTLRSALAMTAR